MKSNIPHTPGVRPAAKLTTKELADRLRVQPQTVRASYCRKGHYLGLVPIKLPNGGLRWSDPSGLLVIEGPTAANADISIPPESSSNLLPHQSKITFDLGRTSTIGQISSPSTPSATGVLTDRIVSTATMTGGSQS